MNKKYPYWIYIAGVFLVWAIVLLIVYNFISANRFHNALIFGIGFLIGVVVANFARKYFK